MKTLFLNQARDNGHVMVPVSPGRYECRGCPASIEKDQNGCSNKWDASKTLLQCPGAQDVPTPDNFSKVPKRIA